MAHHNMTIMAKMMLRGLKTIMHNMLSFTSNKHILKELLFRKSVKSDYLCKCMWFIKWEMVYLIK